MLISRAHGPVDGVRGANRLELGAGSRGPAGVGRQNARPGEPNPNDEVHKRHRSNGLSVAGELRDANGKRSAVVDARVFLREHANGAGKAELPHRGCGGAPDRAAGLLVCPQFRGGFRLAATPLALTEPRWLASVALESVERWSDPREAAGDCVRAEGPESAWAWPGFVVPAFSRRRVERCLAPGCVYRLAG